MGLWCWWAQVPVTVLQLYQFSCSSDDVIHILFTLSLLSPPSFLPSLPPSLPSAVPCFLPFSSFRYYVYKGFRNILIKGLLDYITVSFLLSLPPSPMSSPALAALNFHFINGGTPVCLSRNVFPTMQCTAHHCWHWTGTRGRTGLAAGNSRHRL